MNGKEFKKALDNIVKEKDIDPEVVYEAMELALTSAYKKNFNSKTNVKVLFDRATGEIKVYSYLKVVPDDKIKDLNVFVSDAFYSEQEGKKLFNIVLDSEDTIDLNLITEASRIINKIMDENNKILEEVDELDIYSKEKGE